MSIASGPSNEGANSASPRPMTDTESLPSDPSGPLPPAARSIPARACNSLSTSVSTQHCSNRSFSAAAVADVLSARASHARTSVAIWPSPRFGMRGML